MTKKSKIRWINNYYQATMCPCCRTTKKQSCQIVCTQCFESGKSKEFY